MPSEHAEDRGQPLFVGVTSTRCVAVTVSRSLTCRPIEAHRDRTQMFVAVADHTSVDPSAAL
jgi:hypothetical protein